MPYVDEWHDRVYRLHSDDVILEDISKFHKFVHISFDFTDEEIERIQQRLLHITNTRLTVHPGYANLIVRLHKQLQNYLRMEYKKHFEFPFLAFYDLKSYLETCDKMFEYCELKKPPKQYLKKLLSQWQKANIKHYKSIIEAAQELQQK
jgi:hypothetical protein